MTYFQNPRIASFMISTEKIGVLLNQAREFRLPRGKAPGERLVDRRREVSTLAISILAASAAQEALTLESCLAAPADLPEAGAAIADKMLKPSWNCLWKKRITADAAPCCCRWLKTVRPLTGPADNIRKSDQNPVGLG